MTVWAVHRVRELDISQASTYGEVEYINGRYVYADEIQNTLLPDKVQSKLEWAADKFNAGHDFMLIAGDHLQLVSLAALLADRWGSFRVLRYDREAGGYFPVTISVEG